jgi:hypothetical protein
MSFSMADGEQLPCSRTEAMRALGDIGETRLAKLERDHEIEVVRDGRRAFIVAESLRDYVERLRAAAVAGQ